MPPCSGVLILSCVQADETAEVRKNKNAHPLLLLRPFLELELTVKGPKIKFTSSKYHLVDQALERYRIQAISPPKYLGFLVHGFLIGPVMTAEKTQVDWNPSSALSYRHLLSLGESQAISGVSAYIEYRAPSINHLSPDITTAKDEKSPVVSMSSSASDLTRFVDARQGRVLNQQLYQQGSRTLRYDMSALIIKSLDTTVYTHHLFLPLPLYTSQALI